MGIINFSLEDLKNFKNQTNKANKVTIRPAYLSEDEIRSEATLRGIKTMPLDIRRVIQEIFDINLVFEDMDRNISGYIEENPDKNKWAIHINQYDNPRRQNFTMAHELAHFVLKHNSSLINGRKDEAILLRSDNEDPIEREADDFASNLLMPESEFKNCINNDINTFEKLALHFNVSIAAIKYRAYKLRYIGKY